MKLDKILPWSAGVLALIGALVAAKGPGKVNGFDLDAFGRLPVLEGGRVKPVDTVARNALLMIRNRQTVRHEGRTIGADEWLLDLMFRPAAADAMPCFRIDDPDVLGLIGKRQTSDPYVSFEALQPYLTQIEQQATAAQRIDAKQRTRFQGAVANLFERIYLYYRLRNTVPPSAALASLVKSAGDPAAAQGVQSLVQLAYFRPLPPLPGQAPEAWKSTGEALTQAAAGVVNPGLDPLSRMGAAWAAGNPAGFDQAAADMRALVASVQPAAQGHADSEIRFNRAEPFVVGMYIYVLALLALFVSWAWAPKLMRDTAFALLVAGSLVHTTGLVYRVVLQGRPPVTNLYSSAVFVGWGAVVLGVILEAMYRKGFGTAVAAASGFASLIVAHHLATDGDTMEMMRAVLDSNFWLATHVVTITIGYSGTFLAGAIAIGYALRKHIAGVIDPATTKALAGMTYGVVAFALFFSFVGTVLGGIWADQSWGRFWGWDPKENGALLLVLWNAIILHARWGGFARERGIMAMAIFGNVITSLSWFGVNMLGVGLHSYGFMDKAFWALSAFVASQLLLMGLCMAPRRFWSGHGVGSGPHQEAPTRP